MSAEREQLAALAEKLFAGPEEMEVKNFGRPDQVHHFPNGRLEVIKFGNRLIGRAILEPGWRWSTSIKPLVKTESCRAAHLEYHLSGTLLVFMDDGTRRQCSAGDVSWLPPGHDAWVIGNEPVIVLDLQGMLNHWTRDFINF